MSADPHIEPEVRALIAGILRMSPVPETSIARNACGVWDSLKHVEIVFALEDRYGVQFDEDKFPRMDSTDAIADMVAALLGS